jgi:hypothetical protein
MNGEGLFAEIISVCISMYQFKSMLIKAVSVQLKTKKEV